VYVATGTGIAPLRAMIHEELLRTESSPQVLLFGCRTEDELLYRDELEALARTHARFRYVPTLSRAGEGWSGRTGYVQSHLAAIHAELGPSHHYVCGLTKMIDDVRRTLKDAIGLDRRFVHTERYD
jgi:NAD(P)H-flavin reductase